MDYSGPSVVTTPKMEPKWSFIWGLVRGDVRGTCLYENVKRGGCAKLLMLNQG